ncbi:mannose-6-phosphate isomerase, class I [Arthrobacter sp.]|uniref:mannose-6-phosphate isomerase, class I n=1 Tax=Arthrobacter sp. TaxID=1667 RepID=UPI0026DF8ED9|nr:mannose-6-phosphate isomerase, class I [Arthrobacter sp.]MDO5752811.1 mannose-6-phosphate isomerase, class I [Arthrobacter sp.]
MFALTNVVRDYAWGSRTAIAALLGTEPSGGPEAELWMGAHADSPSIAATPEGPVALDQLIAEHPLTTLGQEALDAFGAKLPFLAKLLAADTALSLQVHPTLERARERFAAEEAAGIPRDAPHRSYKDDNHKPEMLFALTDFKALCGFRPCAEAAELFRAVGACIAATGAPVPELLQQVEMTLNSRMAAPMVVRRAFETLVHGGAESAELLNLAVPALSAEAAAGKKLPPALATVLELAVQYPGDPGVLVSLLLNRVSLVPGEAIYLPAGNIHAYLNGLGLEVMASSDNVLRGGLTGKHVDVPELLEIVDFTPNAVPLVPTRVSELGQHLWEPPFTEFTLQRVEIAPDSEPVPLLQNGPLLVLSVSGAVLLDSPRSDMVLGRGSSVFVPAAENPVMVHPHVDAAGETSVVFAVTCGAFTS